MSVIIIYLFYFIFYFFIDGQGCTSLLMWRGGVGWGMGAAGRNHCTNTSQGPCTANRIQHPPWVDRHVERQMRGTAFRFRMFDAVVTLKIRSWSLKVVPTEKAQ